MTRVRRGRSAGQGDDGRLSGKQTDATGDDSRSIENTVWRSIVLSNANYLASLLAALTISLVLPLVITKAGFANVRLFLVLASFGGLLHFGLLDGFYLTVLGTPLSGVPVEFVQTIRRVTLTMQIAAVGLIALVVTLVPQFRESQRLAIPAVLMGSLTCYVTLYAFLLQGTGRFWWYVRVNAATTLATVAAVLGLAAVGRESYLAVAAFYILGTLATIVFFEAWWARWMSTHRGTGPMGDNALTVAWRRGATLFAASGCLLVAFSGDKLVVSGAFSKGEFAEYAFASGVVGIVYLAFDALAYGINPFIAGALQMGRTDERRLKALFATGIWFAPAVYWPAARVISAIYPQYVDSLPPLRALLTSAPLAVVFRAWVIPAVRSTGREARLLMIGVGALVMAGSSLPMAAHLGASVEQIAWVWTFVIALLGLGGLLILSPRSSALAGPSRRSAAVNATAACVFFLLVARDLSLEAMGLYVLTGGAAVAATWSLGGRGYSRPPDAEGRESSLRAG